MKTWKKKLFKLAAFIFVVMIMFLIEMPKNVKAGSTQTGDTLFEFYGRECGPCKNMEPIIDSLEKNESIKIVRYEVSHNPENRLLRKKYDSSFCNIVPFFINPKTKKWICGATSYQSLKDLAQEK